MDPLPQAMANGIVVPELVGQAISATLNGLVLAWTIDYARRFKSDRPVVRAAVALIAALSAISAFLATWMSAELGARQDRSLAGLAWVHPSAIAYGIVAAITAATVQTFFALRCFLTLPRRYGFVFLPLAASGIATGFGSGLGTSAMILNLQGSFYTDEQTRRRFWLLQQICCYSAAATDALISLVLVTRLLAAGRTAGPDGVRTRQPWIVHLIHVTLSSASLTTAWALVTAILYVTAPPATAYFNVFIVSYPQVYAVSALYVLRSRRRQQPAPEIRPAQPSPLAEKDAVMDEGMQQDVNVLWSDVRIQPNAVLWSDVHNASGRSDGLA